MRHFKKSGIILVGVLLFYNFLLTPSFAENGPDTSKVIIKVDSDGLRAEIISTGKGASPEGIQVDSPQARLKASSAATKDAHYNLIKVVKAISPDYFPKERYLTDDKTVKGARLAEVRYLGDGSAEADIVLYIALFGPFANKFEKEMRLAGYRVVEYDRPDVEVTNDIEAVTKSDKSQIQPPGGTSLAR